MADKVDIDCICNNPMKCMKRCANCSKLVPDIDIDKMYRQIYCPGHLGVSCPVPPTFICDECVEDGWFGRREGDGIDYIINSKNNTVIWSREIFEDDGNGVSVGRIVKKEFIDDS